MEIQLMNRRMIKMGADMMVEYIVVRGKPTKREWKQIEKAHYKKLKAMSNVDLQSWYQEVRGEIVDITNTNSVMLLRDEAETVTKLTLHDLQDNPRDVTWIKIPTHNGFITVFLTGGMSHGETPTDSMNLWYSFNTLYHDNPNYINDVVKK